MSTVIEDKNVDAIIVLLTPQSMTQIDETAKAIVNTIENSKRKIPVIACFMGGKGVKSGVDLLMHNRIPCYDIPEGAVATLKIMMDYTDWVNKKVEGIKKFDVDNKAVSKIFEECRKEKRFELGETEARKILEAYKIRIPQAVTAKDLSLIHI